MIVFPNAKINIGLNVTSKRSDGYHNIQSVFYPVPLFDVLEAVPRKDRKINFNTSGISIPDDGKENLCERAFQLMQKDFDLPGIDVHLLKNIPTGAGLGGGSADGAFMIKLLNDLFELEISTERMEGLAAELGSDCPFFIRNEPALVTGRGEIMESFELDLSGCHLILVHPGIHIPTAVAYDRIKPKKPTHKLADFLTRENLTSCQKNISNDFEKSIFPIHPEIEDIKNRLYDKGAAYASMTGSGSAVYGIFESDQKLNDFPSGYFTYKCIL